MWKAHAEGTPNSALRWTLFGGTRAWYQSDILGLGPLDAKPDLNCELLQAPLVPCGSMAYQDTFPTPGGGTWHVLVVAAPDGALDGTLTLTMPPTTTVLGRSSGPAFLAREDAFRGDMNTLIEPGPGPAAFKWMENTEHRRTIGDHFFGFYRGISDTDLLRMGYDGPQGTVDGGRFYRFDDAPGGDYTFRVDYDVETDWKSKTAVMGASVELP